MSEPTTDRQVIAGQAYASGRYLSARQALYDHQTPTYDLPGIVLDTLAAVSGAVVDVGCGNGRYLRRLRGERPDLLTVGVDVAEGILREVPPWSPMRRRCPSPTGQPTPSWRCTCSNTSPMSTRAWRSWPASSNRAASSSPPQRPGRQARARRPVVSRRGRRAGNGERPASNLPQCALPARRRAGTSPPVLHRRPRDRPAGDHRRHRPGTRRRAPCFVPGVGAPGRRAVRTDARPCPGAPQSPHRP